MSRPRSGGNEIYVVAANCPARLRPGADYVCDGVNDDVQINAALADLVAGYGGVVRLSPGQFTVGAPIYLTQGQKVWGSGMQATSINAAIDHPFDMFRCDIDETFGPTAATGGNAGGTTITFAGDVRSKIAAGATIRICRGTNYGQKRTVSGTPTYAGGTTTVTVSVAFTAQCDTTTVAIIDAGSQLFAGLGYFTASGRRKTAALPSGNTGIYGYANGATTDAVLVDSVGGTDVFPPWVTECSLYIYAGAGIGQMRRILGREQVGGYYTKLLLDGPWYASLDGTSRYAVVGNGLSQFGANCLDFQYHNLWFTQFTGWGVYSEYTWGHEALDLISEYNDMGGWLITQAPIGVCSSTGGWMNSTGHVANSGPKITNCKIVANGSPDARGGTGLMVYGRVIDGKVVNNELGSNCGIWHGIDLRGGYGAGPTYWAVVGNNFGSWDNQDAADPIMSGAVRLGTNATYNTIVGNTCRASNSAGPRAFALVPVNGGQRNVIADNVVGLGTECYMTHNETVGGQGVHTQNYDGSGFNLYRGNLTSTARECDSFDGVLGAAANASGEVTLALINTVMLAPGDTDPVVTFSPADATTGSVTGWYVLSVNLSGTDPKNIVSVTLKSASASSGTTYTFHLSLRHECRATGNG